VTSNPDFKVTKAFNVIHPYHSTSKNSKTVPDKSYIYNGGPIERRIWSIERRHFQWPWTTFNPVFKVTLYFDAEYLSAVSLRGLSATAEFLVMKLGAQGEVIDRIFSILVQGVTEFW